MLRNLTYISDYSSALSQSSRKTLYQDRDLDLVEIANMSENIELSVKPFLTNAGRQVLVDEVNYAKNEVQKRPTNKKGKKLFWSDYIDSQFIDDLRIYCHGTESVLSHEYVTVEMELEIERRCLALTEEELKELKVAQQHKDRSQRTELLKELEVLSIRRLGSRDEWFRLSNDVKDEMLGEKKKVRFELSNLVRQVPMPMSMAFTWMISLNEMLRISASSLIRKTPAMILTRALVFAGRIKARNLPLSGMVSKGATAITSSTEVNFPTPHFPRPHLVSRKPSMTNGEHIW